MERYNDKKIIKIGIISFILVLVIAIIGLIILKYEVEGENNMPFNISKMIVVSSAEGIQVKQTEYKWDFNLVQNNDFYISIEKNAWYGKDEIIKSVMFDNFNIDKDKTKIYMPTVDDAIAFENEDKYAVKNKLEYIGDTETDIKNLKIANQGSTVLFRYSNINLGKYQSNDDIEIEHSGKLLGKSNIKIEDINNTISFDLTIVTNNNTYKANIIIELDLNNLINDGVITYEKTDFSDIVFKRI
ncbi:MAG: hypothetical protein IKT41_02895 [Clostridia bacterium]|nr:hypothetical protein [Clostridia bacterium]